MTNSEMAERFVALLQGLIRQHPKLVFPDERVAGLKQQLKNLRASSIGNPEERMFLFRILAELNQRETSPTMGELSAELGIPLSSATRMADNLVRAKFVERCDDPNDRRIVRLCLTDRGRQFIDLGLSFLRQRVEQVLERLTPMEQKQLLAIVSKLIEAPKPETEQTSSR